MITKILATIFLSHSEDLLTRRDAGFYKIKASLTSAIDAHQLNTTLIGYIGPTLFLAPLVELPAASPFVFSTKITKTLISICHSTEMAAF